MVVLAAVMMRTIADTIVAYQQQVRVIDVNTMKAASARAAMSARP
ncbi:hypothetical protein GCM10009101_31730 [Brevundimonas lenta]